MRTLHQHRSREVRSCSRPGQHRLVHKVVCRSTVNKTTESAETPTTRTQTLQPTPAQTKQQPYRVTQATIDDIKAFHKSQLCEYDYIVEDDWVEGTIPEELVGTYFRNGPGMQTAGRHTFDGDGQVLAFSFDGSGKVRFTNKFVRTRGFLDEQAAGQPVHRTAFTKGAADGSLLFNPFDMQMKNVANTGVLHWGDKLLALYESNMPYELDATSLNTFGECDMNGQLETPVLAAHYRVMPGRQQLQHNNSNGNGTAYAEGDIQPMQQYPDGRTMVGFSFNTKMPTGAEMIFYEFAEDGSLRCAPERYTLPDVTIALIHDLVVTEDYYVISLGPIDFDFGKFVTQYMTSRCSIAECMEYKPTEKPSTVHLVPRPGGKAAGTEPYVLETPDMFIFHHVNAFQAPAGDTGRQLLVLDTVGWDAISFESNQHNLSKDYYVGGFRPELQRLVFELNRPNPSPSNIRNPNYSNPSTGRCISTKRLVTGTMEFPSVNWDWHGRQHRHIYAAADTVNDDVHWGPTQAVLKVTVDGVGQGRMSVLQPAMRTQLWDAGTRRYVNEPLFIPRPHPTDEDDGWVLATVHNAATDKGELVILDAKRISEGPVATIKLPHHLAAGLHGSFSPKLLLKGWEEAAAREWREYNTVRAI